jgi:hypothetical protein
MLKKFVDPVVLEMFLAAEIKKLTDSVNIDARLNIPAPQIPVIAGQLIEQYPVESLEDFVLCFRRGATGFYGSIYRLDAAVLNEWMRAYLEEKYTHVEAEAAKSKKEELEDKIDYKAYADRIQKEMEKPRENNRVVNETERFKLNYTPPGEEYFKKHELHFQYLRENYDARTGHKLPNWMPEEEWIEKQKQNEK